MLSAKFLHALADERRPELHRPLGCATGFFQAFDRHYLLTAARHGHNHKRLPSGHAVSNIAGIGEDGTACPPQIVLERNLSRSWKEGQRASTIELSSRTSLSSSFCSSFSSPDGSQSVTQQDLFPSTDRMLFPDRQSKSASPKLKSSSDSGNGGDHPGDHLTVHSGQPALGIRSLVKDSINRDGRGLPAKACTNGAVKDHQITDSHRQTDAHEKSTVTMDIHESLRVLSKLREAGQRPRLSYDVSRFSYDGKEAAAADCKLSEVPRLSVDINGMDLRPKASMNNADRSSTSSTDQAGNATSDTQQEQPACSSKRLSSVVAKLMGLEALPASDDSNTTSLQTSKLAQERKLDPVLSPLYIPLNELAPQRAMRHAPNSRFPVENAPWKQQERTVAAQRMPKRSKEGRGRKQPATSMYSKIEKRLKELEFQQSNRDLRALKQILDSMQAKGLLQSKKREEASNSEMDDGSNGGNDTSDANLRLPEAAPSLMKEENNAEKHLKSPIVIMKPAKSANLTSDVDPSAVPLESLSDLPQLQTRDRIDRKKAPMSSPRMPAPKPLAPSDRRLNRSSEESSKQKSSSLLMNRQQLPREHHTGSSLKNTNSSIQRLVQRQTDTERRARPPVPSTESNKNQKQSAGRSPLDTVSPRSRFRRKPAQGLQSDEQHGGVCGRTRSLNPQRNEMSATSDGNATFASSDLDTEVTSIDKSAEMNIAHFQQGNQISSGRNPQKVKTTCDANKDPSSDPSPTTPEQPSPISVLDSSFDQEDLCPATKSSRASRVEQHCKPDDTKPRELKTQFKNKKLANVASLLQKLQQLSSDKDDEAPPADHIAFLCETQSPDHRYVSEILLSSGLLMKDLSSGRAGLTEIQLHASGYPVNPDLFLVLEQRKSRRVPKPDSTPQNRSKKSSDPEKAHRKLLFDTVNELLVRKLELDIIVHPRRSFPRACDQAGRALNGQQLVKEVCSELEQLKARPPGGCQEGGSVIPDAEILRRLDGWTDSGREVPGMVLEIERSIFKELVDEAVHGESADGVQAKAGRRRRQNFA